MAPAALIVGLVTAVMNGLVLLGYLSVLHEYGPAPRGATPDSEEIIGIFWALSVALGILAAILGLLGLTREKSTKMATAGIILGFSPLLMMAFVFLTSGQWRKAPPDWLQVKSCTYRFAQQQLVSVTGRQRSYDAALVTVRFEIVNNTDYPVTADLAFKAIESGQPKAKEDFVRPHVEPGLNTLEQENLLVAGLIPNNMQENECAIEVERVAIPPIRIK